MLDTILSRLTATMLAIIRFLSTGLLAMAVVAHAYETPHQPPPAFELVALGVQGGLQDGDLSAWLARAPQDEHYLALDAGTLLPGIQRALQRGAFGPPPAAAQATAAGQVLRERITGYFVSHPHLDHVAGLLIAATDDTRKPIYGLPSTLQALSDDYFNWSAWPNFADRGTAPALGQYALRDEPPGQWFAIEGTSLQGLLLPLRHDRMTSSLLLVRSGDAYLAYFGDTGADAVQHATRLAAAWRRLAPLVRAGTLRALVIEVSYPDDVPDSRLYGHLTPRWLLRELRALATQAGGGDALRGLPVVVTHIKPSLQAGRDPRALIEAQLRAGNDLGIAFVLPRQGDRLVF
ncbi:MAG: 3',5'-cyclic-nucleotide phosphodiesterase [Pseudomonas sp.]